MSSQTPPTPEVGKRLGAVCTTWSVSMHLKGIVMNKLVLASSLSILTATVAFSYNITHPDLKNAHDLAGQAIKQVQGAQKTENTGGSSFGGHAAKAVEL